jgi:mediator of RNA polymerase II transcription subunit 7
MANDSGDSVFTTQMPAPPPYWRQFTKQNVDRVKELQEQGETIPAELGAFVPPVPPENGKYRVFGDMYNVMLQVMPETYADYD